MPTVIRLFEERSVVQILSPICEMTEDRRLDAALALAAANYGIINGCFDYDADNGEIRFRLAQGYMGIEFTKEIAAYMLHVTFKTTARYSDRFIRLSGGTLSLEEFFRLESE